MIRTYQNKATKAISKSRSVNPNTDLYQLINTEQEPTDTPMTSLTFTKINKAARIPCYAHDGDAGLDIWGVEDTCLDQNTPQIISTGLTVEVPYGFELQVRGRSGLAFKEDVYLANGVGTIDFGFKGEIKILLVSPYRPYKIDKSKAIAQLILCRLEPVRILERNGESTLERSSCRFGSRGVGGFGSSDD
jgi:dUTP pyrophosphatase